jgi:hypothetical protein
MERKKADAAIDGWMDGWIDSLRFVFPNRAIQSVSQSFDCDDEMVEETELQYNCNATLLQNTNIKPTLLFPKEEQKHRFDDPECSHNDDMHSSNGVHQVLDFLLNGRNVLKPAKELEAKVTPKVNGSPSAVHCCLQNALIPTMTMP